MKKSRFCLVLSLFALLMFPFMGTGGRAFAQDKTNHINFGLGYLSSNSIDATLAFEHETKYHNSWEYFINTSLNYENCENCGHICDESFWKNYNTIGAGISYKPCITRGRNSHGNLRLGASANVASTRTFVTGIHAGYEHSYALWLGWNIFWQVKCDGMINGKDKMRGSLAIGLKLPYGK